LLRRLRFLWRPGTNGMKRISYSGYRFPPEIIQQAIWPYLRFTLSLRDIEDLLAERGIAVSYESMRRWIIHLGPMIAVDLRKRRPKPHTNWHLDEVYLKIDGRLVYATRYNHARPHLALAKGMRGGFVLSNRVTAKPILGEFYHEHYQAYF
jgi:transposase-like protein